MKLALSKRADADIVVIANYTIDRWGEDQARDYVAGLAMFMEEAARQGHAGRPTQGLAPAIRKLKYRSHFVFFRAERSRMVVLRILHERMDHGRHLTGG